MKRLITISFIILYGLTIGAFAQIQYSGNSGLFQSNWWFNRSMSDLQIATYAMQGSLGKSGKSGSNSGAVATKKVLVATGPSAFKINQPRILPSLFVESYQGTKAEKDKFKKTLDDLVLEYETDSVQFGYPSNDLAFALTYYFYNNYAVYKRITPYMKDLDGKTLYTIESGSTNGDAVFETYKQFSTFLSNQKSLSEMKNDDKQKMAEYLAISTGLVYHTYTDMKNKLKLDSNEVGKLKETAKKNIETMIGSDIDKISFDEKGIHVSK